MTLTLIAPSDIEEIPAALLLPGMEIVLRWDDGTGSGGFDVLSVTDGGMNGVPAGYVRAHVRHWGYILKANDDAVAVRAGWETRV